MITSSSPNSAASSVELENLAEEISARGLEAVTILLLEMHKPLVGLIHSAIVPFLDPFVKPFGFELLRSKLVRALQDQESVEEFICLLEEKARFRKSGARK